MVRRCRFAASAEMIERGEIVDGKTIMLLQHAALCGVNREHTA